jgi:CubicO group peptidase (beta-lactamase class C family)
MIGALESSETMLIVDDDVDLNPTAPGRTSSKPSPKWSKVFHDSLGNGLGGYAYVITQNGQVTESGQFGYTRMPADGESPWSIHSRCNLASVSKTVTATAVLHMVQEGLISSVNDHFWPYLQPLLPNVIPAPGVDTVTISELLIMVSRLKKNGTLYAKPDFLYFLSKYLADNALIDRQLYIYSNTNFTLLQGVIESIAQSKGYKGYVDYVNREIFAAMGVDLSVFSPVPDPKTTATLGYVAEGDPPYPNGIYWPEANCVGPGGWVSSAEQVAQFLLGLRKHSALSSEYTEFMLQRLLGWYHGGTSWGLCHHHNGGLAGKRDGGTTAGSISTGVVSFPMGYDAVLLANKPVKGIIGLMIDAFEAS